MCKYNFEWGRKRGTFICIISRRGRKTVGASAPTAPIRWAPLVILNIGKSNVGPQILVENLALLSQFSYSHYWVVFPVVRPWYNIYDIKISLNIFFGSILMELHYLFMNVYLPKKIKVNLTGKNFNSGNGNCKNSFYIVIKMINFILIS